MKETIKFELKEQYFNRKVKTIQKQFYNALFEYIKNNIETINKVKVEEVVNTYLSTYIKNLAENEIISTGQILIQEIELNDFIKVLNKNSTKEIFISQFYREMISYFISKTFKENIETVKKNIVLSLIENVENREFMKLKNTNTETSLIISDLAKLANELKNN